jgi:hypothetical protein
MLDERTSWSSAMSVLFACSLAAGCKGDPGESDDELAADTESGTGTDSGTETGEGSETSMDTTDEGEGEGDGECTLWVENDCMDPNLKCMPWSAEPDRIPDEVRCCPLDPNPVSFGDRCNVQDYDGSCIDNCPADALCVIDNADGLEGYCQEYCEPGNPDACPPNEICKAFFEMIESVETVPVCMSRCDPLLQDCESFGRPGWSCLPEGATAPDFLCMPPPENPKLEGQPCLLQNDCEVGLSCIPASSIDPVYYTGCDNAIFCCSLYCDLTEPNICGGNMVCIDLESDVPGLENVGICALPA